MKCRLPEGWNNFTVITLHNVRTVQGEFHSNDQNHRNALGISPLSKFEQAGGPMTCYLVPASSEIYSSINLFGIRIR